MIGTHNLADECLEIADRPGLDPADRRVMIDTRLKLIGMWNRKDYGERRELEVGGDITLGDLIEASYKRIEERGAAQLAAPTMTDITPSVSTRTTDLETDLIARELPAQDEKLIARVGDKEMVRTQSDGVIVRRREATS